MDVGRPLATFCASTGWPFPPTILYMLEAPRCYAPFGSLCNPKVPSSLCMSFYIAEAIPLGSMTKGRQPMRPLKINDCGSCMQAFVLLDLGRRSYFWVQSHINPFPVRALDYAMCSKDHGDPMWMWQKII